MKKRNVSLLTIFAYVHFTVIVAQQGSSLAEQLGYSSTDKLLIIHADDVGMSHSENRASIASFGEGLVNSGSLMVPCPWFGEVAVYAQKHSGIDLGIHLTLTSEWKHYKWGPITAYTDVPSLVDERGFFYDNCTDFSENATVEDVEIELRAQIERARSSGVDITHLDTHMGCLLDPSFFSIYIKLGLEYKIPVLLSRDDVSSYPALANLIPSELPMIDRIIMANPESFAGDGLAVFYERELRNLRAGITTFLIHVAYDDSEMQSITTGHPHYGAKWREDDYRFFNSEQCRMILEEEGIKLISWRDIRRTMKR